METLKELSHDTYYNMHNHNQITIDLVEKAEELYSAEYEVTREEFGGLAYTISTVLDVIDKSLEYDVKALETLYFILSSEVYGHRL
jgi:Asp-tRNA(Asn)/Glu-tRNA(Gln) amidotransferase C subunit